MPTTKSSNSTKRTLTDYYVYAPLGAGELLVEKTAELSRNAWTRARKQRKQVLKTYSDLARRGERLVVSVRKSAVARATNTKVAIKKAS